MYPEHGTIEETDTIGRPTDPVGRALLAGAHAFALLGGIIMVGLAGMVVVSVFGRWLFSAPIFGDFEMVAMGTAVTVFLYLPYCHMRRGNVIVDLFLSRTPKRLQIFFDVIGAIALGVIAGMLSWRMTVGGLETLETNETTYILALPLWWAFPFGVLAMGLLALCCLYTASMDLKRITR
mgnify:CR=1 FL=1